MNYINGVEAPPELVVESLPAIHPVANKLPSPDARSYKQTKGDIKKHGLKVAILRYHGRIIDGRTRLQICTELGIEPKYIDLEGDWTDEQLEALSQSLNVHRRHLSREQKDELIGAELAADQELSDRAIAEKLNVSHTTVGTKRRELESTGQLASSGKRKGLDNKKRKAPPTRVVSSKVNSKPQLTEDEIVALDIPESGAAAEDHAKAPTKPPPEPEPIKYTKKEFTEKGLTEFFAGAIQDAIKRMQEKKENVPLSKPEEKLFTVAINALEELVLSLNKPSQGMTRTKLDVLADVIEITTREEVITKD